MKRASHELEVHVDTCMEKCKHVGFNPSMFKRMRENLGTLAAIEKLVVSGEMHSGFKQLHKLGMLKWSVEAAVLKFPNEFARAVCECAAFRLRIIKRAI